MTMMFFWIPLALLLVFFVLRPALGIGCCGARVTPAQIPASRTDDPADILRERLARGEITPEEYQRIRSTLGL